MREVREERREGGVQHRVDEHEHGDEEQQTAHRSHATNAQDPAAAADKPAMSRSLGLPVLILSLAIGGFLFVKQSQTAGPTSSVATQAETQAAAAAAATDFAAAQPVLQAWYSDNGTYAGVRCRRSTGSPSFARTRRRTACNQAPSTRPGPAGQPQPGPC